MLTYTEAVKTVDPNKASGKLHSLWCAFAHFYEKHGDIANARVVFQKATQVRTISPFLLLFFFFFNVFLRVSHEIFLSLRDAGGKMRI